jgi:hypothetical protein
MPISATRLGILAVLVAGGYAIATQTPSTQPPGIIMHSDSEVRAQIERARQHGLSGLDVKIRLADTSYNIAKISFSVRNNNTFPIKDIVVSCNFYAPSGTVASTRTETIMDVFKPGGAKNTAGLNFGFVSEQAKKVSCSPKDFSLAAR